MPNIGFSGGLLDGIKLTVNGGSNGINGINGGSNVNIVMNSIIEEAVFYGLISIDTQFSYELFTSLRDRYHIHDFTGTGNTSTSTGNEIIWICDHTCV